MSVHSLVSTHGQLVNVQRRTTAQDAGGDPVGTWAAHLSGVRMFIQPGGGAESVRYGRENTRGFVVCYVEPGPDITAGDRLTGAYLSGRILDIQSVRKPGEFASDGSLSHLVLECQETDG